MNPFLEAKSASVFRIKVIAAGLSENNNFYSKDVLKEAVPLFNNVRVFVKSDEEHLKGIGKKITELAGCLINPEFKEADGGSIEADFKLLEPTGEIAIKLKEAFDRNMTHLFGFSIDAIGGVKEGFIEGKKARIATKFKEVKSVDLIVEPGAGGRIINFKEAKEESMPTENNTEEIKEEIKKEVSEQVEDGVESLKKKLKEEIMADIKKEIETKTRESKDSVDNAIKLTEARSNAKILINESKLPDIAKARLKERFLNETYFTESLVTDAILKEQEYLGHFTESGKVNVSASVTKDQSEKFIDRLDAFFDKNHKDHKYSQSFKEAYTDYTGDVKVTGKIKDCRFTEALSTQSFPNVLGDSLTRKVIKDYNTPDHTTGWRDLVDIVPINDFRKQERVRYGGYGDLPEVKEGAEYKELTSPKDEKAEYKVAKYGGIEPITLELIKNDDVSAIRKIPTKLVRAAKDSIARFVYDFLKDNSPIYDGKTLFHDEHKNLLADALSSTSFAKARLLMGKQKEGGAKKTLGIPPKYLLVPAELEETAYNLFKRDTNNDETFIQSLKPIIMPIWDWEDADDFVIAASPEVISGIEIGFLDGNEEPEIFIQDNPSSGSMFTHDKITYKIRHIYGGGVMDYRAFVKSVVP